MIQGVKVDINKVENQISSMLSELKGSGFSASGISTKSSGPATPVDLDKILKSISTENK